MRVAVALGGTDQGRSGIGAYMRATLPRLAARLARAGDSLVAFGCADELAAYGDVLDGADRARTPDLCRRPAASALWHLTRAGDLAARSGADVLLLPAANRRATARSSVPTVAVVHDLAQLRVPGKYDALRMVYLRHVLLRALRTSSRLVAISEATRADLAGALHRSATGISIVPNGVEADRFAPAVPDDPRVAAARAHTGLAGPYVLYPARLEHPGKNHLRLLRAFARSRARESHVLALAGGEWGAGPLIQQEIAAFGVSGRVRLLGYVPDGLLPGLVAGADAVAMVGLCEGFGLPALEALAAGRAVFAATTGALPEVVGPLAAPCDPLDEASIAAALDRSVQDETLRARCRDEGPAWAAKWGWDRTADGLLEACRSAAAR